ncbi:hypothetical protein HDK64DRAFT_148212 [Phyllosticta capitalensis]|uniref:Uncharacterized protein n=1 Tax=Phyllosticta capitalensis TaxID=121624 RepID=A0ABR1YIU1_9PEZI
MPSFFCKPSSDMPCFFFFYRTSTSGASPIRCARPESKRPKVKVRVMAHDKRLANARGYLAARNPPLYALFNASMLKRPFVLNLIFVFFSLRSLCRHHLGWWSNVKVVKNRGSKAVEEKKSRYLQRACHGKSGLNISVDHDGEPTVELVFAGMAKHRHDPEALALDLRD